MWDQVLTNLRFDGRSTQVLWTTRQLPPNFLWLPWLRVEPVTTRRLYRQLEHHHPLGGSYWVDQLFGLCGMHAVANHVQPAQRLDIVRQWIDQGRITAWREAPPFTGPSAGDQPVDNAVLAPLYREYAKQIGMDSGTVVAPPLGGSGPKPIIPAVAAVPPSEQGNALPNAVNESCPADNWRSENHITAKPEVIAWLRDPKKEGRTLAGKQDEVLGVNGGGGFLKSTTRISQLKKGDIVFRYYDAPGKVSNAGGWWTTQLVAGDPRQTLALPPADAKSSNSARSMVRAQIGDNITVLTGLGAPNPKHRPRSHARERIAIPSCEPGDLLPGSSSCDA